MTRNEPGRAGGPVVNGPSSILACDAVLFDMDGTLVDSTAVVERIWRRWAARRGIDVAEVLRVSHGRPTLDTLRLVAPHLATLEEAAALDAAEDGDTAGLRAVPGALELTRSLPPDRWAVVTSAGRALAARRLRAASIQLPRVLVGSDDVRRGKPDPGGYVEAARSLGVEPSRCLVVEDAPVGIEAARAAGALAVGVATTFPELGGCDYLIPDLRAIRLVEVSGHELRLAIAA
jgi:sugar-phosphatase